MNNMNWILIVGGIIVAILSWLMISVSTLQGDVKVVSYKVDLNTVMLKELSKKKENDD